MDKERKSPIAQKQKVLKALKEFVEIWNNFFLASFFTLMGAGKKLLFLSAPSFLMLPDAAGGEGGGGSVVPLQQPQRGAKKTRQ